MEDFKKEANNMAKRRLKDADSFRSFCIGLAQKEVFAKDLKLTNEEFETLSKSEHIVERATYELNKSDLTDRLMEESRGLNYSWARTEADSILKNIAPELMVNLEEWLEYKPLTNIKMGGKTVNDILKLSKDKRTVTFTDALLCLSAWKAVDFKDEFFCERYFSIK